MNNTLDLSYPRILTILGAHLVTGRTESRAFLGWFLENYFRLDGNAVDDAICDGPDDKGIDGLYVDDALECIYIFQAKLLQKETRWVGDSTVREFSGALNQLRARPSIEALTAETRNTELRGLLVDAKIAEKVESGFEIKGVLVSNAPLNPDGTCASNLVDALEVYDRDRLKSDWLPLNDTDPIDKEATFHLDALGVIEYRTERTTAYIASLRGTELLRLAGIENQSLFAWNVRNSLGRTKVNKAIAANVNNSAEHKNFMLYHNGLTILATEATYSSSDDTLKINGYSVVNGAQSLSTLYDRRNVVSDDLRLLTKVIELPPSSTLASMITRNSNNQNAIGARDLQSNSLIQKRLKTEFSEAFGKRIGYEIKRGDAADGEVIVLNSDAAKALLAFDLEEPWACHQSYRHFDDLHSAIFARPEVNAKRIVALMGVRESVLQCLPSLDDQLVAHYAVTPYFMMYLVKNALAMDPKGQEFCRDPGAFLRSNGYESIVDAMTPVVLDLTIDLNAEIDERNEAGAPFDYKRELKSSSAVRAVRSSVIPSYQKAIKRGRASSFGEEWMKIEKGE